jgi:diacylglycerol diphosphate phosphatase / phosphatidate phosphatase
MAFDRRGHVAKLCIIVLLLLLAAMVAVSRVGDYWHHWQDVFTAGALGIVFWRSVSKFRKKPATV